MDMKWLKTFVTAAKTENFHQTAERLYIAQPTVTVHIKQIESLLGVGLFEKKGRNIALTTAGKRFLPYAINILGSFEEGIQDLETWGKGYKHKISLAVSPLIAASILPNFIRIFMKRNPTIEVAINVMESNLIGEAIRNGSADIGLSRVQFENLGLTSLKLYEDPIIAIAPHDGGDAESALPLEFEKVIYENIILSHNHPVYWDDLLFHIKQKYPRICSMVVSQVNVTKRFIEEGLGISFLPRSTVTRELLEGRVLEVFTDKIALPVAGTYVVTKMKSEVINLFITHLCDHYK
ncbi:LysR family transcriptional regulator [Ferdinandcohnia quinoae]|uniref:LysR family transcriptional regulator n=1 Tax=Fredinandcohnia quinoae TaxID=2918902 RepID=A0AAW5E5W6_9BACI|nr:LysR family transcriptional regulator [Fredinandcohnia sp. SECRCQ15]MCH1627748.1 LysR family transcriptional regulator [Fredinandcohnia sp. SECRCQ15]